MCCTERDSPFATNRWLRLFDPIRGSLLEFVHHPQGDWEVGVARVGSIRAVARP